MLTSFSVSKAKNVLSMEIYDDVADILNTTPQEFTLNPVIALFTKFELSFEKKFDILLRDIERLPKKKTIQNFIKVKETIVISDCYRVVCEINALVEELLKHLAGNDFSKHCIILARMFSSFSYFLEKVEDTPIADTPLHQIILAKAHKLTSHLCYCYTNEAEELFHQNPKDAQHLFDKAIIYGELCIDYQNALAEFPLDTSNNKVNKLTTEALGFLAKSYMKKGQLALAMETLLEMHSHIVKFNIAQSTSIGLVINVCQNLCRAILFETIYSLDILLILQPTIHIAQRYFKLFSNHKVDPDVYTKVSYEDTKQKVNEDITEIIECYRKLIQAELLRHAIVVEDKILVEIPPSITKEQIEKEIRTLKMVANQSIQYEWLPDQKRFFIGNLLNIDLVSLSQFDMRLNELISKYKLIEERRLLYQFENQKNRLIQEIEVAKVAASSVLAVSAAIPTPASQAETTLVKSVANLSLKPKKHKRKNRAARPAPPTLIAIPASIIKYGKDFGYNETPFADARCAHLRKGVYVLYSPGQFHRDQGCDDSMQARFEALAATPTEARKVDSNGFKMWPVRSASGDHTFTIEGKLTTSPLRLLPSKSCTNAKGERAYYFDTIKNTKKGKRENRYKA